MSGTYEDPNAEPPVEPVEEAPAEEEVEQQIVHDDSTAYPHDPTADGRVTHVAMTQEEEEEAAAKAEAEAEEPPEETP